MRPDGLVQGRTNTLRAIAALAIAGAVLGGCAGRSTITGRVRPASPDVVIMAWPVDGKPAATPRDTARVVQVKGRFEPRVLVVQTGTPIAFENRDKTWHNAFCVVPGGRFDLGRYRKGQVRQTTLGKPGVYQVFCEMHPKESLYVVVVPDRWHTTPADDGSFSLAQMPRGEYVLRAWHPVRGQVTKKIAVPTRDPALLRLPN